MKNLVDDASFSPCGLYRWWLRRSFGESHRRIVYVGLNPSKANKTHDDNTVRRLTSFSKCWGYGSLIVVNLFAIVGSKPSCLRHCRDPIGDLNDYHIESLAYYWSKNSLCDLWLGWGNGGSFGCRDLPVIKLLKKYSDIRAKEFPNSFGPLAFSLTQQGSPRHPIYVPRGEILKPFPLN